MSDPTALASCLQLLTERQWTALTAELGVMPQHLPEEVDHFRRGDPFVEQAKQHMSFAADCRHRGHAAPFAGHSCRRRLATRRPSLAQQGCQRNVRFVLKVQDGPVFLDLRANLRDIVLQPFFARLLVDLEVLPLRFLIRQADFTQPSPDRIQRDHGVVLGPQHLMHPTDGPQVGFKSERRRGLQDDVVPVISCKFRDLAWPTTAHSTLQPSAAIRFVPLSPTKQRGAIHAKRRGNARDTHAAPQSIHCFRANFNRRITARIHDERVVSDKSVLV